MYLIIDNLAQSEEYTKLEELIDSLKLESNHKQICLNNENYIFKNIAKKETIELIALFKPERQKWQSSNQLEWNL
jgi:hypothetical protein